MHNVVQNQQATSHHGTVPPKEALEHLDAIEQVTACQCCVLLGSRQLSIDVHLERASWIQHLIIQKMQS